MAGGIKIASKYWAGPVPPKEYYVPVDLCRAGIPYNFDLAAIIKYARRYGKEPADLTYDEVSQYRLDTLPPQEK